MTARADALVQIFARAPLAGRVKTRLAADIGARQCLQVYRGLLGRTVRTAVEAGLPAEIHVAGPPFHPYLRTLCRRHRLPLRRQHGADLGERMWRAIRDGLGRARTVIVIGSDSPGLTPAHLQRARDRATVPNRVVIGPSDDGGYYLIAVSRAGRGLFRGIDWGTELVFGQALKRIRTLGLEAVVLPPLTDVDDGASLAELGRGPALYRRPIE